MGAKTNNTLKSADGKPELLFLKPFQIKTCQTGS